MTAFKAVLYLLLLLSLIGSAGATTYTVGASGCDYTTIQAAVNAASSGDTVYVCNGSYTENVDIATAHLTIEGEGRDVVTVTAASSSDHVFDVSADYVNVSGFNLTGATGDMKDGMRVSGVEHCRFWNNTLSKNYFGIQLYHSGNNTLTNNTALNNEATGIGVRSGSCYNMVTGNNVSGNWGGILVHYSSDHNTLTGNTVNNSDLYGIDLHTSCCHNTLANNTVSYSAYDGIMIEHSSSYNTVTGNTASNNRYGIRLYDSNNDTLTDNNALSNIFGVRLRHSSNNLFERHTTSSTSTADYYAWYVSLNNTLLDCNLNNSTSSINDSTSEWIIRYTASNITDYSDTTINQTISPTNVSTTIAPTVDDYNITMTTLDDFSATTDVSTASLQLTEFASGGHSKFNVSSAEHAIVTTFNLGTFPVGQAVRLKRNNLDVTCARAGASGIATFIYDGGYSDNEFETDPVGLYVHLNDTQNYTFTNDSYDASAFTSQVTVTSTGSPPCAVSVEMPLITNSTYTELGYTVTNVTGGFRVTNASGWAAINFTVTNTTTIRISPSTAAKTSNLPAVVTGIGGVTVVVYLLRRRRR